MSTNQIALYDCTLRDGTQGENVSFSVEDKLRIARKLDEYHFDYIEGGWPGSNPKDAEFFRLGAQVDWEHSKLAAFGSTRRWKNSVSKDPNIQALLDAQTPVVTLVGKSWDFHVEKALGITLDQNLTIIRESIAFLKERGKEVLFDAEHFFDGYRHNPEYAQQVVEAAQEAGADTIILCDTNGGSLPSFIGETVGTIGQSIQSLGIHTHNDCELGVATSVAAVQAGAQMVQGTINGYGERTGNANLTSIIPVLELKLGVQTMGQERLSQLTSLAYFVSETANLTLANTQPFVGRSAFAHKGGIHVSAILKDSATYEHIGPETVGNRRRVLVSDLSGRSNLIYKIKELEGVSDEVDMPLLLKTIKQMEYEGYQFEGAQGSLRLLIRRCMGHPENFFDSLGFRVLIRQGADGTPVSEAIVKFRVGEEEEHTVAEGNGPVHALDRATKKALSRFFPEIERVRLTDYKVRVLDAESGTAGTVRVLITSSDGRRSWTTIGVSTNLIEASWKAILDSVLFELAFGGDEKEPSGKAAPAESLN